ncbi:hypothetical protein EYF80_044275 [Liparis tanakae]|uniref:Uncharacterized protein n=1 Tax=Liparis tanakae TaxID=230148 RepID=A0A4Z2FXQ8_9TELE|nr:hypothetical protein EYF80_044275 [Liparis tanakae]
MEREAKLYICMAMAKSSRLLRNWKNDLNSSKGWLEEQHLLQETEEEEKRRKNRGISAQRRLRVNTGDNTHILLTQSLVVRLTGLSATSYLLLGFHGGDGWEQSVDAAAPHPLPASAARHVAVEVKRRGASRRETHPDRQTPSCPSSSGRLTIDELVSRRRPDVYLSGQRCHSAESGHCCCCCCRCAAGGL